MRASAPDARYRLHPRPLARIGNFSGPAGVRSRKIGSLPTFPSPALRCSGRSSAWLDVEQGTSRHLGVSDDLSDNYRPVISHDGRFVLWATRPPGTRGQYVSRLQLFDRDSGATPLRVPLRLHGPLRRRQHRGLRLERPSLPLTTAIAGESLADYFVRFTRRRGLRERVGSAFELVAAIGLSASSRSNAIASRRR